MLVLSIVGARPQFVKAAAFSPVLRRMGREFLVHTGQHYDAKMSGDFFRDLALPEPEANLGIGSGPHGQQTGAMLVALEKVALDIRPDWILIYGDTNSTLAGALVAAKLLIPLAHVEAGLRSFNRAMPEEINRVVADRLSDLLFCPTDTAVTNLRNEGITEGVHRVGDIMVDVVRTFLPAAQALGDVPGQRGLKAGEYAYLTLHRAENVDPPDRLRAILMELERLPIPVLWTVHPRTRGALERLGRWEDLQAHPTLHLVEPLGYLENLAVLRQARLLLTDSGGLQKEAAWLGTPCVTLRNETEWIETVQGGWNRLWTGGSLAAMLEATPKTLSPMPGEPAAERMGEILQAALGNR